MTEQRRVAGMPAGVWALAVAAFAIGTTEFVPMGVLPVVATSFDVSLARAGNFIAAYALGVVVGAMALTVLTTRWPRKRLLMSLLALFLLGNALTAVAPGFGFAIGARFVTGLPHGAFFGAGAMVAAHLAGRGRRAAAVAHMLGGLTAANVFGVPGGVLIANQLSWRCTFVAVLVLGAVALLAVWWFVPHQPSGSVGARRELAMLRRRRVLLALGVVVFGFAGVFACYSYIAPLLTEAAGFSPQLLPVLLMVVGVGMTAGNFLGGRLADRAPVLTVVAFLVALIVFLLLIQLTATSKPWITVNLFAVGVVGLALSPAMQARVMEMAHDAASLSSAAVQAAFNVANSLGAWAGGLALGTGLGLTAPSAAGAGFALLGLILLCITLELNRRVTARGGDPTNPKQR